MTRVIIAAIALGPVALVAAPQQPHTVFHGGTDVVTVDVTVQRGKAPVTGLEPADFEVDDNGVRQVVTDLSYSRMPIDLRLVFDTSGSIDDTALEAYIRAMKQVTQSLQPQDRCDILTFSGRIVDAAALQYPPVRIDAQRIEPDTTSFFDAVSLALMTRPIFGRRQLTIVMTDADDNSSFFDEAAMLDIARRTDAVVYAVLPIAAWRPTDEPRDRMLAGRLGALTTLTGGRVIVPNRDLDVAPAFLSAVEEFRKSYVLVYTATGVERAGWHELSVHVRGQKSFTVRARQGYMG